jgi:hypothetical protein
MIEGMDGQVRVSVAKFSSTCRGFAPVDAACRSSPSSPLLPS